MRSRSDARREREGRLEDAEKRARDWEIDVPNDPVNEQVVLAAMIADDAVRARLVKLPPDAFFAPPHRAVFVALQELERRKLAYDPATVARLNPEADVRVLETLAISRPDVPPNIDFHTETLAWDHRRATVTKGPLAKLLEAVQNPKEAPDRVRALARAVGESFDQADGASRFVRNSAEVVREMMARLRARVEGEALYPFGVPGLDTWEAGATNSKGEDIGGSPRIIPGAAPGNATMLTGMSGAGKALALDTPIATARGWTTMGAIAPGEVIFDERGERCLVTFCSTVMHDRECYELEFSDGAKIVADAEHLWKTVSYRERYIHYLRSVAFRAVKRKHLGSKARRPAVSASLDAHHESRREDVPIDGSIRTTRQIAESLLHGKHRNHALAVAGPIVMPEAKLLLDPYALGLWLGDGASDGAVFYTADPGELLDAFVVAGFEVSKGKSKDPYRYNIRGGLVTVLRALGVLGGKHVPQSYLRGSIGQRIALLQGLMDTDGCCDARGGLEFCTTSPRLARDFAELLASLGIKGRAAESDAVLEGRVVGRRWRFAFMSAFAPFRLLRKLERWVPATRPCVTRRYVVAARKVPSVPVRCIQVDSPSRLYLAGREMVPTHNTTLAGHMIIGLARQRRRVAVGAWEVRAPMTLELLTVLSLGWSRVHLLNGKSNRLDGRAPMEHEEMVLFEEQAHRISKFVVFIDNPFRRGSIKSEGRVTNDDYLDVLEEHVEISGADVALYDLFDRVLRDRMPNDEQEAVWRMLEFTERLQVHSVIVHQQLIKGEGVRADMKPTIQGLKGSSAYVDAASLILAPHLPARWKRVPDDTMEVYGLKQRYGPPFSVEFDWDPDTGQIAGGRAMDVDSRDGEASGEAEAFGVPKSKGGKSKGRR